MSPSAGERISSKQVEIKQREFPVREPGERQFKVLGNTVQKKQPKEGGATYVDFQMEPINLPEGTPTGRAFPAFYTDSTPNSQGAISYEGPEGCFAFGKALGDELDVGFIEQEVVYTGKKAQKMGKTEDKLVILNPDELVEYIKAHDGAVVTAYEDLKKATEKEKEEYPNAKDRNIIRRWIIPEGANEGGLPGLPKRR